MSAQEIIAGLSQLSAEERGNVARALQDLTADTKSVEIQASQPPRRAGLHEGDLIYIADDFDAPLPDSFWLGQDA